MDRNQVLQVIKAIFDN